MITIDADGQHDPRDIEKFFPLMREGGSELIIGCRDFNTENVPASSRFGRSFANFWLKVETGQTVDDCQSGFRAYPVRYLNQLRFKGNRYDFEAEVLAKAAWAGLELDHGPDQCHVSEARGACFEFQAVSRQSSTHAHPFHACGQASHSIAAQEAGAGSLRIRSFAPASSGQGSQNAPA